jgi:MFS family permease
MIEFTFQALTSFLPLYLVVEKNLDPGTASALYGLFFGIGIVVQPVAGRVADRYGYRLTLLLVTSILSVGLAALPSVHDVATLALLVVFMRIGHAGIAPITMSYLISALPVSNQGSGFGIIRTIYLGISALGATFVGVLADAGLFDEAFLALAGLTGVALLLYTALPSQGTHG